MKKIKLTKNKYTLVDDEDYEFLNQWKWHICNGYASRYMSGENGKRVRIGMHNLINNPSEGLFTDHINRNRLDNRKQNLRSCTFAQNIANRNIKQNRSGYRGVIYEPTTISGHTHLKYFRKKPWRVIFTVNNKKIFGKYFKTKEEAAKEYNILAIKFLGKFAILNKID